MIGGLVMIKPLTKRYIEERKLIEKYYDLFQPEKHLTESLIRFGLEIGMGWFPLIEDLCKVIKKEIKNNPSDFYITQIKEKFGGLRFYVSYRNKKIDEAINKAEEKSFKICEVCGKRGKLRDDFGWILTLCSHHYKRKKAGLPLDL